MTIVKRIREGDIIPTGYGVAWYERDWHGVVCLPLGLNWLIATIRRGHIALRHASNSSPWDLAAAKARSEGWTDGYAMGCARADEEIGDLATRQERAYREGWNAALKSLENMLDKRGAA